MRFATIGALGLILVASIHAQTTNPAKLKFNGIGLYNARIAAGLSQQQLADKLDLSQRAYAYWERHPVALRPDQLEQLAIALNVSVSDLIGEKEKEKKKRGTGPTGRMKQLFEQANDLPRSQQQKIAAVLEAFITQNRQTSKQKA